MSIIETKQFIKKYEDGNQFFGDLERAQEAYDISQKATIFRSPEVLDYDIQEHSISFEFLENAITVRKLLRSWHYLNMPIGQLLDLFYNIGVALAEYHMYSGKLHGDFQPNNVMFEQITNKRVYLIDFSRSELSDDPHYNRGSIYKDLAHFAIHIKIKYPYWLFPFVFRKFNDDLCKKMLKGYQNFSKITIKQSELDTEIENYRVNFFKNTFMFKFFRWHKSLRISLED